MKKITHYVRKWRALAAIFLLAAFATSMQAQNVTIRGNNGSCVAAVKNGGTTDTFFGAGGFATWQHEQLSMVLTTSDGTVLTPNKQLDNPANNLFVSSDGTKMQIAKGQASGANVCYVTLSLPKGYRFTGYSIRFTKPRNVTKSGLDGGFNTNGSSTTFGETNSAFSTYMTPATPEAEVKPYADIVRDGTATIGREETESEHMSNVLYFKLEGPTDSRALIQLEDAEFWFTAEENYSPVTPAGPIASPVSAVDVPFNTSRVDFGAIANNSYGNYGQRISYSSANVHDLQANFMLYEEESVENGADIDGVTGGKIVKYEEGTISSAGGFFKLGRENQEQVYYLEAPTSVEISDDESHKVPVGYRIIGAEFEYTKSVDAIATRTFYITYTSGNRTYYLDTEGQFSRYSTTLWEMDADGFISSNGYYMYFNNGYVGVQRGKPADTERFGVNDNGIFQVQWPNYYICYSETQVWGGTLRRGLISKVSGQRASYIEYDHTTAESSVGNFILKVYDKTGQTVAQTRNTANGDTQKITLTGLNNDAVKFSVQGIGLVRATLTLQALNPYLDQMTVVCNDEDQPEIRMTQTFTASDFSVSGGKFYFYLPTDCEGDNVNITFEELKSKYFDETYPDGSVANNSRINFVKSAHYNAFGASNNNIYTNVSEAASASPLERRTVGIVGTSKFKFNNADEVGTSGGTLREYPFSLENYAAAPNNGSFGTMDFVVSDRDQTLTRYVFTTDETRYNIAPTTAMQHRAYAFYEMEVHVQSYTYDPKVAFTKVYGKTLYRELLTDEKTGEKSYGGAKTDAFYGVTVTAYDGNNEPGYSSTEAIFNRIEEILNTDKVDDSGNTDLPASAKQILYLDFSQLKGVYQKTTSTHESMEAYSATNAANCIIFLPVGSSAPNDNVAYKTQSGTFRAANNLVLTDMQPFYIPYDIVVPSTNTMSYQRKISKDKYGKVQNASLILPFEVALTGGKHTNADGTSFTMHTMQSSQALRVDDDKVVAFFPAMTDVTTAAANTPYLVKIDGNSSADGVTFTISQPGGLVSKTTSMASDYTFAGSASSGVTADKGEGAGTWTFTPMGTYAGQQVAKANNVFYFANNIFVSSKDLDEGYGNVNIAPFRAYYATSSNGAKLASFTPVFEEGEGDVITAIAPIAQVIDVNAPVYDLQGRMVATSYSELNGKKLAAGMYVVNGVKFIVK